MVWSTREWFDFVTSKICRAAIADVPKRQGWRGVDENSPKEMGHSRSSTGVDIRLFLSEKN
jgi:hypothetical protein